jgi:hypothetical protein
MTKRFLHPVTEGQARAVDVAPAPPLVQDLRKTTLTLCQKYIILFHHG